MKKHKKSKAEPTEPLSTRVEAGLLDAMKAALPPGFSIGQGWTIAARQWLSQPAELRMAQLTGMSPTGLVELIQKIVDERLGELGRKRHRG